MNKLQFLPKSENPTAEKKHTTLRGTLLCPLAVGSCALILHRGQLIRTSHIVAIRSLSPGEVCFETLNTHYTLLPDPIPWAASRPLAMSMAA